MPLPQGFKKNIKIVRTKIGPKKRQEILDDIDIHGTFLPKGVLYEDMDSSFVEFIDKNLEIVIDDIKVPVIFLTIQRWAEFSKTWEHADEFKDIKLPFITIVRKPDVQVGTNQAGNWNIPGRRTYTYIKVPTFEGGRKGVDLYKIPQPTSVDVSYEVRLFCNRMRDLNKLHRVVQQTFQSRQFYLKVNGHPMPVILESIGDESPIDDFENRRFYIQLFEMTLLGYLLDEEEFEVVPTINRALIVEEVTSDIIIKPRISFSMNDTGVGSVNYKFIFKPKSESIVTFNSQYNIQFSNITNIIETTNIVIKVNGVIQTLPFNVSIGDTIVIDIDKELNKTSSFQLIGNLI